MPRMQVARRRGVILLVVLCMLTLLALLGVAFVFYAAASFESARLHVESLSPRRADADPDLLLAFFLGQLMFDAPDDESGYYSALRGHSLGRDVLGMDYLVTTDGTIVRDAEGALANPAGALNAVPFNGVGRQRLDPKLPFPELLGQPATHPARDDANLVNYTYFRSDKFLRDPERPGWRDGPRLPGQPDNRRAFSGGFNAPYTYPDLAHVYLAAVKADGNVLLPSYHRPWAGFGSLAPDNWRWTSDIDPSLSPGHPLHGVPQPWLKYLVLRPRPADMAPGFPLPEDEGGDVKNLVGAPGGNDSIWLDLDFPVLRAPDGRKVKPLFAPLVVDLDGRINLNTHGNLRGVNSSRHSSHQGWGPWEVNPGQLGQLPPPKDPGFPAALQRRMEWGRLLRGVKPAEAGRYGWDNSPHSALPGNLAPLRLGRLSAPADFDGSRELATGTPAVAGRPTAKLTLPGAGPSPAWLCFPTPAGNAGYGNGSTGEQLGHPLLYDPHGPRSPDRAFALSELEALMRHGDTGSQALGSELLRLCPRNLFGFSTDAARRRRMVTLASFDPDRPGVSGWFWTKSLADPSYSRLPVAAPLAVLSPHHPAGPGLAAPQTPFWESDFGSEGRAAPALTALRRIDLDRHLPDYPLPDSSGRITDALGFVVAQTARQHFAAELFELFWRVTGAGDPTLVSPPWLPLHDAGRWDALRYLAQLAVNIVDQIDSDDYMTPFNWYPHPVTGRRQWAHGTELPRVVLNEAYVEYVNAATDPGLKDKSPRATRLRGNVWVELHNTLHDDPPLTAPWRTGATRLEVPASGSDPGFAAYRLLVARLNADLRRPDNVRGDVTRAEGSVISVLSNFTSPSATLDTRLILPADRGNTSGGFAGPAGGNRGFYVLGPEMPAEEKSPFPAALETLRRPEMSYVVPSNHPRLLPRPSLVWQRLACPHLPPQASPALPLYNPYITVDYLRDVEANYAAEVGMIGANDPPPTPAIERTSLGRRQPYAAHASQVRRQAPIPVQTDQPQHTFFQHNADNTTPGPNRPRPPKNYPAFEWLVHLDRPPSSPVELLHVSAFKPHELTQQFRTGDAEAQRFSHRAPWLDEGLATASPPQSHRLYRALEFLTTGAPWAGMRSARTTSARPVPAPGGPTTGPFLDQAVAPDLMAGVTASGGTWRIEPGSSLVIDRGQPSEEVVRVKRVGPVGFVADFLRPHTSGFTIDPVTISERLQGKVNLNTVWDEEVFLALCDPNPANLFHAGTARTAFRQLRASRTVGGETPGPNDRPLMSFAAGLNPGGFAGSGIQDTLFCSPDDGASGRPPILAVPGRPHPYQTYELLTKLFNSTTVRSNVFAVWVTVGFFEVADDSVRPVKLGPEVGRAESRHIRHRMFAIVDRSVLLAHPGPQPRFDPRTTPGAYATGRPVPYFSVID